MFGEFVTFNGTIEINIVNNMETKESDSLLKLREFLLNPKAHLYDRIQLANKVLLDAKFITQNNELRLKPKPGALD